MRSAIQPNDLKKLQAFEAQLKSAVSLQEPGKAESAMKGIQQLLMPYGMDHPRLLECRLWYFESQFDANHISTAESGFHGITQRASRSSRLHLEASFFLGLCYLRQKRFTDAKKMFRAVVGQLNKITSNETRQLFQKRIVQRIEQECVLTSLIGVDEGRLVPAEIHEEAVKLLQRPEGELFEFLSQALPYGSLTTLDEFRTDVLHQLPPADRKFLPAPEQAKQESHVGKIVFAVLKRIGWKTFCAAESPIYKLWSQRIPDVYSAAYFATALTKTFDHWKIGIPLLAAGVSAIAMKYGAKEFCALAKPDSIMDSRRKRG